VSPVSSPDDAGEAAFGLLPLQDILCEARMSRGLRKWPAEQMYRLVELWADPTKSITAIARELGVDCSTVIRRAEYLALRERIVGSSSNRYEPGVS
jgi:hypothetical protein